MTTQCFILLHNRLVDTLITPHVFKKIFVHLKERNENQPTIPIWERGILTYMQSTEWKRTTDPPKPEAEAVSKLEISCLVLPLFAKWLKMYTLTWELQEIRFVAEDQVVVGNKVEEPNIQLLCIVALRIDSNKRHVKTDNKDSREDAFQQISVNICYRWRLGATAS